MWRKACDRANDWERAATSRIMRETKDEKKRINELERDLARKEKALAEAAPLMLLRKKGRGDLGPRRRGRMTSIPDRQKIVALIDRAMAVGARLATACAEIGLNARTLQSWTGPQGAVRDDLRPFAAGPLPANKLSNEERDQIVATCDAPEFASLHPARSCRGWRTKASGSPRNPASTGSCANAARTIAEAAPAR